MRLHASLLDGTGSFLHWGVIQISVANVIVIALMVGVFVLALLVPFGRRSVVGARRRRHQ